MKINPPLLKLGPIFNGAVADSFRQGNSQVHQSFRRPIGDDVRHRSMVKFTPSLGPAISWRRVSFFFWGGGGTLQNSHG